ncbi:MAG: iron donor protein CyaY [Rickettsia endosymbiont of Bryobia graminum]|nr:iron donor protein CyaY [Rickettsia endosymbiont of Bryobia graminum]
MDDTRFLKLASQTIARIAEIIEKEDPEGHIDVDFQGDILNLTTDQGIYVINKHSAAKEIWLSSPISGPYHFYYNEGKWQSKTNNDLMTVLEQELKFKFISPS